MCYLLERNDVVAGLHIGDTLANRLDDTSALMTQDDGEGSLGVLAGQGVGICVADTSVVDLNTDFVGSWGQDFDVFDREVLAGFPGDGGLLIVSMKSCCASRFIPGRPTLQVIV